MEKKFLVVAALVLIMAVVLSACVPAATVTPTGAVGTATSPFETATVGTPSALITPTAVATSITPETPTSLAATPTP